MTVSDHDNLMMCIYPPMFAILMYLLDVKQDVGSKSTGTLFHFPVFLNKKTGSSETKCDTIYFGVVWVTRPFGLLPETKLKKKRKEKAAGGSVIK